MALENFLHSVTLVLAKAFPGRPTNEYRAAAYKLMPLFGHIWDKGRQSKGATSDNPFGSQR